MQISLDQRYVAELCRHGVLRAFFNKISDSLTLCHDISELRYLYELRFHGARDSRRRVHRARSRDRHGAVAHAREEAPPQPVDVAVAARRKIQPELKPFFEKFVCPGEFKVIHLR